MQSYRYGIAAQGLQACEIQLDCLYIVSLMAEAQSFQRWRVGRVELNRGEWAVIQIEVFEVWQADRRPVQ